MKRALAWALFLLFPSVFVMGQSRIFRINDAQGRPLRMAIVKLDPKDAESFTVRDGILELKNSDKALSLHITFPNGETDKININAKKAGEVRPAFIEDIFCKGYLNEKIKSSGGAGSPKNYWIGAKVGYNLSGVQADDNFVGAVKAAINLADFGDDDDGHFQFAVLGNFGKYKFDQSKAENQNLQKLSQSISGIQGGLGWTRKWAGNEQYKSTPVHTARLYAAGLYKYNQFVNIGTASEEVNLHQIKVLGGFEYEYYRFKQGGALSLAIEPSLTFFDKQLYQKVFSMEKSVLAVLDASLVIPISSQIGLYFNGTYSHRMAPAHLIGFVIKVPKAE